MTRVPAVGGVRDVPAPDEVARDYLLLALRLDQHVPGLVDGYYRPADLKARVDMESIRSPTLLRDDAAGLRERVRSEVAEAGRRAWLDGQLRALEAQAAALAGVETPYVDQLEALFGVAPVRRDEAILDAAAARLDELVPGTAPLDDRLRAWDDRLTVGVDRLPAVVDWLVAVVRSRADALFGRPEGDEVRVSFVRDQPWGAYTWYEGGLRSRIDINLDLPVRAPDLIHLVAHETYPGHHLEHAWKERSLVEAAGRLEASILLINTPECLISEGLADAGLDFVAPADDAVELLDELFARAGLPFADDRSAAREIARLAVELRAPRRRLAEARVNAALMRHADGASHDAVLDYLRGTGHLAADVAAKRLEFIEHPLWRTYVFVYHEGEALLRRWLAAGSGEHAAERFGRLLREALTPQLIGAEVERAEPGEVDSAGVERTVDVATTSGSTPD